MERPKYLKYCPKLNTVTGSITASLLMCQLEYWFDKVDGKAFYKFLEPCQHKLCKKGDSWTEELGFSLAEFRSAFKRIGKVYKSKKAYLESADPFDGKPYLSYYDRIKKLTFYIRNPQTFAEFVGNALSASGYNKDYASSHILTPSQRLDKIPYEHIVALFKKHCPSLKSFAHLTPTCKRNLVRLWKQFAQKGADILPQLEQVFKLVEASDFLCGRLPSSTWHAQLQWIVHPDKFMHILSGKYAPFDTSNSITSPSTSLSTSWPTPYIPPQHPHKLRAFDCVESHHFDLAHLEAREQAHQLACFTSKMHKITPSSL